MDRQDLLDAFPHDRDGLGDAKRRGEPTAAPARHPVAVAVLKSVHTMIFLGELAAIGWLAVTGITGRRDRSVAIAAGAVAAEAAVFLGNGRVCPLTPMTERLGAERGAVSDIFLPRVVAESIPIWSSALVLLAGLLHLRGALGARRADGPDEA